MAPLVISQALSFFLVKQILAIARQLPIHSFSHVFFRPSSALLIATDIFDKRYTVLKEKRIFFFVGKALNTSRAEFR